MKLKPLPYLLFFAHRPQVHGTTIDGAHSRDLDDAIWADLYQVDMP